MTMKEIVHLNNPWVEVFKKDFIEELDPSSDVDSIACIILRRNGESTEILVHTDASRNDIDRVVGALERLKWSILKTHEENREDFHSL